MLLDLTAVQALVRDELKNDRQEMARMLRLAVTKPILWQGLKKDEVIDVLRVDLKNLTGMEAVRYCWT